MLEATGLRKEFSAGGSRIGVLNDANLRVEPGEMALIRGPSGCGKSTLLLTLGAMLRPDAGSVQFEGRAIYAMPGRQRNELRRERVGFVFQSFQLIPYLSVLENVRLAAPAGHAGAEASLRALDSVGLDSRLHHRPDALSSGEQQRTAIARALVKKPALMLADEPTGNLDEQNEAAVFRSLAEYRDQGGCVVVVTHGSAAEEHADSAYQLLDGRLEPYDRSAGCR